MNPPQAAPKPSRPALFLRAAAAMLAMAFGLGAAGAVGDFAAERLGFDKLATSVVTALVCTLITVSLIVLLRRRLDHRPLSGLGLVFSRAALGQFALGVAVTGGSAAALLAVATTQGWLAWGTLDGPTLLAYLVTNALIAFALEALPEELAFRGYIYRTLNRGLRRWVAFVGTVALFAVVGGTSNVCKAAVAWLLGGDVVAPSFAPPGENPIDYLILMVVFGSVLLIARMTTGSLWTTIGLHLTFLTVNRVAFVGVEREAGWSAELLSPDAILLVPLYLLLSAVVFWAIGRLRGRRIGWRERDPE